MKFYKTDYKSPIGKMTIYCDEKENIVGLWIEGQKYLDNIVNGEIIKNNNLKIFDKTKKWLDAYFRGQKTDIKELSLKPIGNKFKQHVWQIVREIPYGKVTTYGDIAKQIAQKMKIEKMSAQAVGGAVGHNPIPIIIPCHRVVGKNGKLTGYAAGIDIKEKLLNLEQVDLSKLAKS